MSLTFFVVLFSLIGPRLLQIIQLFIQDLALSADNQAVLTELAQNLQEELPPPWPFNHYRWGDQQLAVLKAGLLGACVIRIIALILAQLLLHVTVENTLLVLISIIEHVPMESFHTANGWLLFSYRVPIFGFLGGFWLIKTAVVYWLGWDKNNNSSKKHGFWSIFWEIIKFDFVLSIDNIISASEVSHEIWIIMVGVMIAILLLVYAAPYTLRILRKFPLMEKNVYYLLLAIGLELWIDSFAIGAPGVFRKIGLPSGVPDWLKISVALGIIGGTIVWSLYKKGLSEDSGSKIIDFDMKGPVIDGYIITPTADTPGEFLVTFERLDQGELLSHIVNTCILIAAPFSRGPAFDRFLGRFGRSVIEKEIAAIADVIASEDDDGRVRLIICSIGDGHGTLDLGEFTVEELKKISIDPETLGLHLGSGRYMLDGIEYAEKVLAEQPGVTFLHMVALFYRSAWDQTLVENWRKQTAIRLDASIKGIDEKLMIFWKQGILEDRGRLDSLPTGVPVDPVDVQTYRSVRQLRKYATRIGKELLRTKVNRIVYKKGVIQTEKHILKRDGLQSIERGQIPLGAKRFSVNVPGKEIFEITW